MKKFDLVINGIELLWKDADGEARFNGVPTGINIVKGIYFNDKIIEL